MQLLLDDHGEHVEQTKHNETSVDTFVDKTRQLVDDYQGRSNGQVCSM
jgi:hypothetical protein